MSEHYLVQNIGIPPPNFLQDTFGVYGEAIFARVFTKEEAISRIDNFIEDELEANIDSNKQLAMQFVLVPFKQVLGIGELVQPTIKHYAALEVEGSWSFNIRTVRRSVTRFQWEKMWARSVDPDNYSFFVVDKQGDRKELSCFTDIFYEDEFEKESFIEDYGHCSEFVIATAFVVFVSQIDFSKWNDDGDLFKRLEHANDQLENLITAKRTIKKLEIAISKFQQLQNKRKLYWTFGNRKKVVRLPIIKSDLTVKIKSAQLIQPTH